MSNETGIPGSGKPGGLVVILDSPSKLNWLKRQHVWGDEEKILYNTLRGLGNTLPVYITYAIKTLLDSKNGKTRRPTPEEFEAAHHELMAELLEVSPKKILTMGGTAYSTLRGLHTWTNPDKNRGLGQTIGIGNQICFLVPTIPLYYVTGDPERFRDLVHDLEKIVDGSKPHPSPIIDTKVIPSLRELKTVLAHLHTASSISFDLETTGLDPQEVMIQAIGLGALMSVERGVAWVIPPEVFLESGPSRLEDPRGKTFSYSAPILEAILEFFETYQGKIVLHNAKFDLKVFQYACRRTFGPGHPRHDYYFKGIPIADTIMMSYLLDERPINTSPSPHGLKTLTQWRYDVPDYHFNFEEFWSTPTPHLWDSLFTYLGMDLYFTLRLYRDFLEELLPCQIQLLEVEYYPGIQALADIELHGALVDRPYLEDLKEKLKSQLVDLKTSMLQQIEEISGEPWEGAFNPNSPIQISKVVYEVAKIPIKDPKRKTEKELLLHNLAHPKFKETPNAVLIKTILKYREVSKTLSTYVIGILDRLDKNNRVHPEFNQHGTVTGRLSATNPNLQNMPVLMGPLIRAAFIAPEGYEFGEGDYSQLELRVGAWYSKDTVMYKAFQDGRDIHKEVAAAAFETPYDQVTYDQRYAAKYIDFGIFYGRTAAALAGSLELSPYNWSIDDAQTFIDNFLGQFHELHTWMENQKHLVHEEQEIWTPNGRVRRWPLLMPKDGGSAERQAINTPVQGLASDFTFTALVEFHYWLRDNGFKTKVVGDVHDSILLEIYQPERDVVCAKLVETMRTSHPVPDFDIPLLVDVELGPNWGSIKAWERPQLLEPVV